MNETISIAGEAPTLHFTYVAPPKEADLQQGDILSKTAAIEEILADVHPYYRNDDYTHFIILTQTCDLVRRGGSVRSRYITLAAVRPFVTALERELSTYQTPLQKRGGVASNECRYRMKQFMDRVVNNNDANYFYLHAESTFGMTENSCVFLALSIAIKADMHYETCRKARILRLRPAFQARLGWAVGNQYSRVATEDYIGGQIPKGQWERDQRDQLNALCRWFPEGQLKKAEEEMSDAIQEEDQAVIREYISDVEWKSRRETVAEAVVRVVEDMYESAVEADQIKRRLMNDPEFKRQAL